MSVDEIDQLLSARGDRYQRWGDRGAENVPDLGRRAQRQRRKRAAAAGAVVATVILGGASFVSVGARSEQSIRLGGTDEPAPSVTAAAPIPTSAEPPATADPSTTEPGPVITVTVPRTATPTTVTAGIPDGIRRVDWANRDYPADACGAFGENNPTQPYRVRQGVAPGTNGTDLTVGDPAYGDVTGDGREDAVVPISCRASGGSHAWGRVWLYTPDPSGTGGAHRLTAVAPFDGLTRPDGMALIDARSLESATVTPDGLSTRWVTYADDDPNCCPSKRSTALQRWNGTALVTIGTPVVTDA